eukprot:g27972.t1
MSLRSGAGLAARVNSTVWRRHPICEKRAGRCQGPVRLGAEGAQLVQRRFILDMSAASEVTTDATFRYRSFLWRTSAGDRHPYEYIVAQQPAGGATARDALTALEEHLPRPASGWTVVLIPSVSLVCSGKEEMRPLALLLSQRGHRCYILEWPGWTQDVQTNWALEHCKAEHMADEYQDAIKYYSRHGTQFHVLTAWVQDFWCQALEHVAEQELQSQADSDPESSEGNKTPQLCVVAASSAALYALRALEAISTWEPQGDTIKALGLYKSLAMLAPSWKSAPPTSWSWPRPYAQTDAMVSNGFLDPKVENVKVLAAEIKAQLSRLRVLIMVPEIVLMTRGCWITACCLQLRLCHTSLPRLRCSSLWTSGCRMLEGQIRKSQMHQMLESSCCTLQAMSSLLMEQVPPSVAVREFSKWSHSVVPTVPSKRIAVASTESSSSPKMATCIALGIPAGLAAAHSRRRRNGRKNLPLAATQTTVTNDTFKGAAKALASPKAEEPKRGHFPPKATPLLDSLGDEGTQGIRSMTVPELKQLSEEVRWQVLDAVSVTGGHLGAGLGVVELTVALHHVYDTPRDEICWDVAHQCQPHKVLTGRRSRIYTLRQGGGLSGFAKRKESVYDAFGAGHSSTSISAAVGFQTAKDRLKRSGHSIAVIGDGAITGGMAWEAMNHAGGLGSKVVVILNDNGQVSLPTFYNQVKQPVGALSETLAGTSTAETRGLDIQGNIAKMETSQAFQNARQFAKSATKSLLPDQLSKAAAKLDEYTRDFVKTVPFRGSGSGSRGELFEQLGFYYVGPIDGHDMDTLASDKLHAVQPKFNVPKTPDELQLRPKKKQPPLTKVFADQLVREGQRDEKVVAITAAMPGGTGIGIFEKTFGPERTFDVGIAEQHAVTFAAGLAAGGLKPFCAIYSTFLQRAYDQLVHDVALQKLPVRFVLDRAGLVGADSWESQDGATHCGAFDLSYLSCIPEMMVCASADEAELIHMVHTLAQIDDAPTALRFPRGSAFGDLEMPEPRFLEPGKGRIAREGRDGTLAILSIGGRLRESLKAAEELEEKYGISATVLLDEGYLDGLGKTPIALRSMVLPDRWIDHNTPELQYDDAKLNAQHIIDKALAVLDRVGVKVKTPVRG